MVKIHSWHKIAILKVVLMVELLMCTDDEFIFYFINYSSYSNRVVIELL